DLLVPGQDRIGEVRKRAGTQGRTEITDQIGLPAEMPGKLLRPGSEENMITHGMTELQFGPARPVRDIKTQGA
ncbi:hypothetical protein, partial [Alistipes finegoldii]|uniref:hypothetical protein n=1 Tax=Alistipes finegoldii TaxID=214856 RepID=UPI00272F51DB